MQKQNLISQLFLEIEGDLGTRDLNLNVLNSLESSVKQLQAKDEKDFLRQFYRLSKHIKNARPRIGIIIENMYEIWKTLEKINFPSNIDTDSKIETLKQTVYKIIKKLKDKEGENKQKIIEYSKDLIQDGDVILLHSHSSTVLDTIKALNTEKKFSCIVAEQEHEKTQNVIYKLHQAQIPFKVVPEYILSNVEDIIDKIFLGAVTLNSFNHIVGDSGTASLVSQFNGKIPIYMFMTSKKCSFWKAEAIHHTCKLKHTRSHHYQPFKYSRIKFSHDRVPADKFDYFVTENGILTSKEMTAWYKKVYKNRRKWREEFFEHR